MISTFEEKFEWFWLVLRLKSTSTTNSCFYTHNKITWDFNNFFSSKNSKNIMNTDVYNNFKFPRLNSSSARSISIWHFARTHITQHSTPNTQHSTTDAEGRQPRLGRRLYRSVCYSLILNKSVTKYIFLYRKLHAEHDVDIHFHVQQFLRKLDGLLQPHVSPFVPPPILYSHNI